MTTGKAWTPEELEIIVRAYLDMLLEEVEGRKFNKSAIRRAVLPQLDGRSAGSYEMKCCNISAAARDMGYKWISGYKPLPGYQRAIKAHITEQLCSRPYLFHIIAP